MEFQQLSIHPTILKALAQENYVTPTPIQEKAIPPALSGRDLLGCAQTGTGKTAAFAVPILQRLAEKPLSIGFRPVRALILTPTRELALQIYESFCAYGRFTSLRAAVIFGGVAQGPQEQSLRRGVDILVATPGRLNDLIGQGLVKLDRVEILTLDEADRMLDMGFIHDVKKILAKTPEKKQTLFFSATIPPEIAALSDSLLHDPVRVDVAPEAPTVDLIAQSVYFVDKVNKRNLLLHLLKDNAMASVLVFTRTKHGADRVVRELQRGDVNAQAIHGDKSQASRQQALNGFKAKTLRVLVATDIAARGIDIDELSHVVNYDLPDVPETYVHRIGRTGRAGRRGIAISFCDIEEKPKLADIEKFIRRKVPVQADHPFPMQVFTPPPKAERPPRPPRSATPGNPAGHRRQFPSESLHRSAVPLPFAREALRGTEPPQKSHAGEKLQGTPFDGRVASSFAGSGNGQAGGNWRNASSGAFRAASSTKGEGKPGKVR